MHNMDEMIEIGVYAEDVIQLEHALILVESIRIYGGGMKDLAIRIYIPETLIEIAGKKIEAQKLHAVEYVRSQTPEEFSPIPFAGKVFAAALAETEASKKNKTLVWMDEDTVVLEEPAAWRLTDGIQLAYRPVMHQNIGSTYSKPPDDFWKRIYSLLHVSDSSIFPIKTVADGQIIRPYINAGLLIVKSDRCILRNWVDAFSLLVRDSQIASLCQNDPRAMTFLYQAALSASMLTILQKNEILELPSTYNVPLFFDRLFKSDLTFDSIQNVVSIRYDVYFETPALDWPKALKGPEEKISWLKSRFDKERQPAQPDGS